MRTFFRASILNVALGAGMYTVALVYVVYVQAAGIAGVESSGCLRLSAAPVYHTWHLAALATVGFVVEVVFVAFLGARAFVTQYLVRAIKFEKSIIVLVVVAALSPLNGPRTAAFSVASVASVTTSTFIAWKSSASLGPAGDRRLRAGVLIWVAALFACWYVLVSVPSVECTDLGPDQNRSLERGALAWLDIALNTYFSAWGINSCVTAARYAGKGGYYDGFIKEYNAIFADTRREEESAPFDSTSSSAVSLGSSKAAPLFRSGTGTSRAPLPKRALAEE